MNMTERIRWCTWRVGGIRKENGGRKKAKQTYIKCRLQYSIHSLSHTHTDTVLYRVTHIKSRPSLLPRIIFTPLLSLLVPLSQTLFLSLFLVLTLTLNSQSLSNCHCHCLDRSLFPLFSLCLSFLLQSDYLSAPSACLGLRVSASHCSSALSVTQCVCACERQRAFPLSLSLFSYGTFFPFFVVHNPLT